MKKILHLLLAVLLLATSPVYASKGPLAFMKKQQPAAPLVESVQHFSISVTSAATTGTATINSVDTTRSFVKWNGCLTSQTTASSGQGILSRVTLTNATTVTVTRGSAANSDTLTCTGDVVQFVAGALNTDIQRGTIAITTTTLSNTATLGTTVSAKAFVLWQGASYSATNGFPGVSAEWNSVDLTNTTTVTARRNNGANSLTLTVGYTVVDLKAKWVTSVQSLNVPFTASTATTNGETISTVVPEHTLVFNNGSTYNQSNSAIGVASFTCELTNATTMTWTRASSTAYTGTLYYSVVEFTAAALNGSVQRASRTLSAGANTWTLTNAVDTTKSMLNFAGWRSTVTNPNLTLVSSALASASTVTSATSGNTGTPVVALSVAQFN